MCAQQTSSVGQVRTSRRYNWGLSGRSDFSLLLFGLKLMTVQRSISETMQKRTIVESTMDGFQHVGKALRCLLILSTRSESSLL